MPVLEPHRDADSEVDTVLAAAAAGAGSFALLVGGPCTGKTRCAYEAIRRGLPDWWLIHPANGAEVRALLATPPRSTVVWLDEIQRYLGGSDGLNSTTVLSLLRWGAPVALIGTIWPDIFQRYMHRPVGTEDPYYRERSVLRQRHPARRPGTSSATRTPSCGAGPAPRPPPPGAPCCT